jgi:hypothetical protein
MERYGWTTSAAPGAPTIDVRDDLVGVFTAAGVEGTFVLYDVGGDRVVMVDQGRATTRFVPASTWRPPTGMFRPDEPTQPATARRRCGSRRLPSPPPPYRYRYMALTVLAGHRDGEPGRESS